MKSRCSDKESLTFLSLSSKKVYDERSKNISNFYFQDFETNILKAMKEDGWDGYEPEANKTQWTFTGSLFYSIIVITTIGETFSI